MKKIKFNLGRIFVMAAFAMGVMSLCNSCMGSVSSNVVTGNLNYTQADLKVKSFTEIEVDAAADVYYVQDNGDKQEVRLDFSKIKDDQLREQFKEKTKVVYRDGKVIVGLSGKITGVSKLNSGERMCVYITSTDLVKISLEGIGSFNADAINSDTFSIDNEGVGNVRIKNLLANKVNIDNEGVGNVKIGNLQSDNLTIDNEGVGNVKIDQFKGGQMKIDNEGVGKVEAHVDCQSIQATLEGVGNINLSGVTQRFSKDKDGVGAFHISDLKILNK